MNLITISEKYNTKYKCYKHLEKVRWNNKPVCPHCANDGVTKRKRPFYYHCNKCNKDFTVLYGTIMEASKMPLPKWFLLIALMLNARKGISAKQLQRNLGVTYKSAWYSAMRVRCAMVEEPNQQLLEGIVEMDEAYVGGKPRKRNTKNNVANLGTVTFKRGRGTKKVPIVGIVEREGKKRVRTEVMDKRMTTNNMLDLLRKYVNLEKAIVMTDEARFYNGFDNVVQHLVIKHKESYAEGIIHTNTIEGVWSIIKNGIRGEYHVLSRKYLPFYLAEFAYKYNTRSQPHVFDDTLVKAVEDEKCLVKYKPKKDVRQIAYGEEARKETSTNPKPKLKLKSKRKKTKKKVVSKKVVKKKQKIKKNKTKVKSNKKKQHKKVSKKKVQKNTKRKKR